VAIDTTLATISFTKLYLLGSCNERIELPIIAFATENVTPFTVYAPVKLAIFPMLCHKY